jgi:hypothetical protein
MACRGIPPRLGGMPLTPAHPAVVLPLQWLGLPLSALVAGAIAPDVGSYVPWPPYTLTHSALGVVTVDIVIGLGLLLVWFEVLRDPFADLVSPVRNRVPACGRLDRRGWLLAPIAVFVGAATHVVWDSATHKGRWLVEWASSLQEDYGPLPAYRWAQHFSTVVGIAIVTAYVVVRLGHQPVRIRPSRVRRPHLWLAVVPGAALVAGLAAAAAREPAVAAVQAAAIAAVAVALAWRQARPAA